MANFSLFSVIGIEIEYMLAHAQHFNIAPKSDVLLQQLAGKTVSEISLGDIAISNEFVMHVIELKNSQPQPLHAPLMDQFQQCLEKLFPLLAKEELTLLPTAMHPWMDPGQETRFWPYHQKEIYQQYHKIFDCKSHGWANLQSMHINLPFSTTEEFSQLHNAIRLLLPLLPAIAASSPYLEGKYTGMQDARLYYYARNQQSIPAISGAIIPEFIRSEKEYQEQILTPMYAAIHPMDPNQILQKEWLNSRGSIAKFTQNAIEIRLLDTQECVRHDIAIAMGVVAILQSWLKNPSYFLDHPCPLDKLTAIYQQSLHFGLDTLVEDPELLRQWQLPLKPVRIRDIWYQLLEKISLDFCHQQSLERILHHGNLSQRLLTTCGNPCSQESLRSLYKDLNACLQTNEPFV